MLGKTLVHERVVGCQQVENTAVLANDTAEEQFGLALEGVAQIVIEIRKQIHDRLARFQRADAQPLAREVLDQRDGVRIGKHSTHLLLEHGGIFQLALYGDINQLIVGDAAPQEK